MIKKPYTACYLGCSIFNFNSRAKIAWAILAPRTTWKKAQAKRVVENMKRWILELGKAEIGLGIAIFGISVKNYRGYRSSRPNPWLGGPFRGRLKISIPNKAFSNRRPRPIFQSKPLCDIARHVEFQNPDWAIFARKTELQIHALGICFVAI